MTQPKTKQAWTDELKAEAVEMYLERMEAYPVEEQPNFSMEVAAEVAVELEKSPNSVRSILQRAKREDGSSVYVKKAKAPKATKAAGTKKMSKADAQAELTSALKDLGAPVDDELAELISKMTGKAATALAGSLRSIDTEDAE